jgi:hypothetical protein
VFSASGSEANRQRPRQRPARVGSGAPPRSAWRSSTRKRKGGPSQLARLGVGGSGNDRIIRSVGGVCERPRASSSETVLRQAPSGSLGGRVHGTSTRKHSVKRHIGKGQIVRTRNRASQRQPSQHSCGTKRNVVLWGKRSSITCRFSTIADALFGICRRKANSGCGCPADSATTYARTAPG